MHARSHAGCTQRKLSGDTRSLALSLERDASLTFETIHIHTQKKSTPGLQGRERSHSLWRGGRVQHGRDAGARGRHDCAADERATQRGVDHLPVVAAHLAREGHAARGVGHQRADLLAAHPLGVEELARVDADLLTLGPHLDHHVEVALLRIGAGLRARTRARVRVRGRVRLTCPKR